jgi:hypothetical protein
VNELEQVLMGDSAHTPPAIILEGLASEAAHCTVAGAPRTIYEELWHIAFWQQVTLDWIRGAGAVGEPGRAQCLPLWADCAAAATAWIVAAAIRRLQLVKLNAQEADCP